jgi:hypothetical protein
MLLELDGLQVERFGEHEYLSRGDDEREEEEAGSGGSEDESSEEEAEPVSSARSLRVPSSPPRTPSPGLTYDSHSPSTTSSAHSDPSHGSVPASESPSSRSSPSRSSEDSFSEESFDSRVHRIREANPLASAQRAEEAALRTGERLLSRVLFVGGEGLGFGEEICECPPLVLARPFLCRQRHFL